MIEVPKRITFLRKLLELFMRKEVYLDRMKASPDWGADSLYRDY